IGLYWADGQGTETPPGHNLHLAYNESVKFALPTMEHVRVMAYDAASLADAGIAAWDTKFTYWVERPFNTINREIDAGWSSLIPTPGFPGYVSGHSTFSAASAETLSYFFPDDAVPLRAMATEAAMSRYYAGIHIQMDNEVGLVMGASIGDLAAARAAADGGPGPYG
ncbi:MAG: vanadium-dependent haloperoxidase, partial [Halobacteriales archaeon]|nr:vanadium-dependent haloperoxidase [Halobacteriales archaeon]